MLDRLREHYTVGIVGAGDFEKQQGQLGGPGLCQRLDFVFSENGVHSFKGTELLHCKSIAEHVGLERWATFEKELGDLLKANRMEAEGLLKVSSPGASLDDRGTFLERRECTANVCVIGRTPSLSKDERAAFERHDKEAGLRQRVLAELVRRFGPTTPYSLNFSIGGQIGIDVAPVGWDKTFCLRFLDDQEFSTIHFFGDKTHEGGGDYELFVHPRTVGHTVADAEDTLRQVEDLLLSPAALAAAAPPQG